MELHLIVSVVLFLCAFILTFIDLFQRLLLELRIGAGHG